LISAKKYVYIIAVIEKRSQWQLEDKIIKIYKNALSAANIDTKVFTESLSRNALQLEVNYSNTACRALTPAQPQAFRHTEQENNNWGNPLSR